MFHVRKFNFTCSMSVHSTLHVPSPYIQLYMFHVRTFNFTGSMSVHSTLHVPCPYIRLYMFHVRTFNFTCSMSVLSTLHVPCPYIPPYPTCWRSIIILSTHLLKPNLWRIMMIIIRWRAKSIIKCAMKTQRKGWGKSKPRHLKPGNWSIHFIEGWIGFRVYLE